MLTKTIDVRLKTSPDVFIRAHYQHKGSWLYQMDVHASCGAETTLTVMLSQYYLGKNNNGSGHHTFPGGFTGQNKAVGVGNE